MVAIFFELSRRISDREKSDIILFLKLIYLAAQIYTCMDLFDKNPRVLEIMKIKHEFEEDYLVVTINSASLQKISTRKHRNEAKSTYLLRRIRSDMATDSYLRRFHSLKRRTKLFMWALPRVGFKFCCCARYEL